MTKLTEEENKRANNVDGGEVKLANSTRTYIPASAATSVRVTGPVCSKSMMIERLEGPLPGNMLLVQTLVNPSNGIFED